MPIDQFGQRDLYPVLHCGHPCPIWMAVKVEREADGEAVLVCPDCATAHGIPLPSTIIGEATDESGN
jgi:hypothetical protein